MEEKYKKLPSGIFFWLDFDLVGLLNFHNWISKRSQNLFVGWLYGELQIDHSKCSSKIVMCLHRTLRC